jgi:hypothetical protein
MLPCNETRDSAALTQPTQLVVNGVKRARVRARDVQTKHCVSCVSSQDSCAFPADEVVADPGLALAPGQGSGWAPPAASADGRGRAYPHLQVAPASAAAVLEPARAPGIPPLRLQHCAILALDLGQKTGWAVRNTYGAIASGTVEFRPGRFEGGGMVYLRFRAWLQEVDETAGGIGAVYFEEVRFHRGVTAAHAYGGYLAHLTAWAEMFKIPYRGVPVGTIKRHVTGRGNADKEAVIAAVRALGFDPADDNEADALALLDWALRNGNRQ